MITQTELDCIKGNVTNAVGLEAIRYQGLEKRGYDPDFSIGQLKIMDYWVLDQWTQNQDGTTTGHDNYITQAEFDQFIDFLRTYAACTS